MFLAVNKIGSLLNNEFIFNGFLVITLGAFGIASVDKYINRKNEIQKLEIENNEEQPTE